MFTQRFFFAMFTFSWSISSMAVPGPIKRLLDSQRDSFVHILQPLTQEQRAMVLDRYTELLMLMPYTSHLNMTGDDLRLELENRFGRIGIVAEPVEKKGRVSSPFSDKVAQEVELLEKAFGTKLQGKRIDVTQSCDHAEYVFPLLIDEIITKEEHKYSLKLKGVFVPEDLEDRSNKWECLEVLMEPTDKVATLNRLGTKNTACPIPKEHGGDCLIDLAERIARAAGKTRMILDDQSRIRCALNRQTTNLSLLKYYKEGRSYYEKRGYKAPAQENHSKRVADFMSYSIATLEQKLKDVPANVRTGRALDIVTTALERYKESERGSTVAQFMSWLWKDDCIEYLNVNEVIMDRRVLGDFTVRNPRAIIYFKDL